MSSSDSDSSEKSEETAITEYTPRGTVPQKGTKSLPFTSPEDETPVSQPCDTCGLLNKTTESTAFCPFCKRYMCVECQHSHSKSSATSTHVMLTGKEMPITRVSHSPRKDVNRCENHAFKMAEFYCPKHNDVFCIDCKESKHIRCQSVIPVRTIAKGVKTSKEFSTSLQNFRKMVIDFEKIKTMKISQQERLQGYLTENIKAVNALRNELNELLDRMEKNIKEAIEKMFSKEISDIEDQKSKCEAKASILQEEISTLGLMKSAEEPRCFIAMLKANKRFEECETVLNSLTKQKTEMKYEFEPNQRLLHSVKELDTLGNIKTTTVRPKTASSRPYGAGQSSSLDSSFSTVSTTSKGKEFALCGEHKIDSPEDNKQSCSVTGSAFLSDGRLLLCDSRNNNVKLFDHIIQHKSTLKLHATPYDVTGLKTREAVVTVPEKKELHFALIDSDIRASRVVKTEMGCHGIRNHRDGLLTTCYSRGVFGVVLLLDTDGNALQRFERDRERNAIFQGPYHLAVSHIRDRFYVTDKAANTVLGMTMGGKILFR